MMKDMSHDISNPLFCLDRSIVDMSTLYVRDL